MSGESKKTPVLTETDLVELDIVSLLQSPEAIDAFDTYGPLITLHTAARFADLLRMINGLSGADDFAAAVDAAVFGAVHSPADLDRLERFGALSTDDPVVKLAAVQMLRTWHEIDSPAGPGNVR